MISGKNVLGLLERFVVEQKIFIFLLINVTVNGLPQNENVKEPVASAMMTSLNHREVVIPSPIDDEKQYLIMNGIFASHPHYRMTFNPTLLMRPQSAASYAEVSARTLPKKIDNRMEPVRTRQALPAENKSDGKVIFPTSKPSPGSVNTRINITPNTTNFIPDSKDVQKCERDPFKCNGTQSYPKDYIKQLLSKNRINKDLFTIDVLEPEVIETKLVSDGDSGDGRKQFCDFTQSVTFPEVGKDKDGFPRFIIQLPEVNITQGIRVEKCLAEGESSHCGRLKSLLSYQSAECVQKYSYRNLVTLDNKSGNTVREPIQIPSCCVCMYRDKK